MNEKKRPNLGDAAPEGIGDLARQLKEVDQHIGGVLQERESAVYDSDLERSEATLQQADIDVDRLKVERSRVLAEMANRFEGVEGTESAPSIEARDIDRQGVSNDVHQEQTSDDPYRYAGRSLNEIKRELRKIKGWDGVQSRINRRHGDSLGGDSKPADILLDDLAREVNAGMRPVTKAIWSEFYDRYNPDGTEKRESSKKKEGQRTGTQPRSSSRVRLPRPQGRYFDANDCDPEDEYERSLPPDEWVRETPGADLPHESQSGYDSQDERNRSGAMTAQPEQIRDDEEVNQKFGHELGDDLKQILAENDTEAFYGAPASPLNTEAARATRPAAQSESRQPAQTHFDRAPQPIPVQTAEVQPMNRQERQTSIENDYQFEIGGVTFKNGEMVTYTEADGDKGPHMIIQKVGENPARLRLLNLESGAEFAIDEDSISRIEKLQDGEGGGNGPEDEDPIDREGGEQFEGENPVDNVPQLTGTEQILEYARASRLNVEAQIRAIAQAKEEREKLFSLSRVKSRQERLDESQNELQAVYERHMNGWADTLAEYRGQEASLVEYRTQMETDLANRQESLERLEADENLTPETKALRIRIKREAMEKNTEAIDLCNQRILELQANVERITQELTLEMTLEMAQTRTKIEEAQTELKAGKFTQKFKNWWRGHPKTRLAIGVGLGIGGALLSGPAGIAMMAGAAAMRGAGGYMGTEAAVNLRRSWWANRSDKKERETAFQEQNQTTQWAAERTENDILRRNGNLSETQAQDLNNFITRHAAELGNQELMRAALAGNTEASAQVASMLLSDQLERVTKDAQSNRRAKVAGVVVGAAAAAAPFVMRHFFNGPPEGPKTPPPEPPQGEPYNPLRDRFTGIMRTSPEAPENWQELGRFAEANPQAAVFEQAKQRLLDEAYSKASQGMGINQLRQLNDIIGVASVNPGNEEVAKILPAIATQVRNGMPTEQILTNFNIPVPPA